MTPTPDIDTHSNWLSEAWRLIDRVDYSDSWGGAFLAAEAHLTDAPTGVDTSRLWDALEDTRQRRLQASGAGTP